jgi:hypothetical protein
LCLVVNNKLNELEPIQNILKRLEKLLLGFNYECFLEFELIIDSTDISAARKRISSTHNFLHQNTEELQLISYHDFKFEVNDCLSYRGERGSGVELSQKKEEQFQQEISALWNLIEQQFNPATTDIFIHPEIHVWIYWGFCFLIVAKDESRIYLFEGLASD